MAQADTHTLHSAANDVLHTTNVAEHRFVDLSEADPLAAFCFAVGVLAIVVIIAAVVSPALKSRFKWLGTMGGKFFLVIVGAFFLLLPIAIHLPGASGALWPTLAQAIPATFYYTVNITGLSGELELWTPVIYSMLGHGLLATLYYQVLCFYTVAAPIMLALTAVDLIANGITGAALFVESLKKSVFRRHIYVFYGLNESTCTLAIDLLSQVQNVSSPIKSIAHPLRREAKKPSVPLLIFCNSQSNAEDNGLLAQQVRQEAYGCATVLFTPLAIDVIPNRLSYLAQTRCPTYYLIISGDTNENVRAALELCDSFGSQMAQWEMDRRRWDLTRIGEKPSLCSRTKTYARNIHVWCAHSNPDDGLVFDALPQRRAPLELIDRLARHDRSEAVSAKQHRRAAAALAPLMERVRNLIEVRLISEEREVIWDTLVAHPLTSVLDDVDLSTQIVPVQHLYVVVLGLGAFGSEAVRAAFWLGRLPGVELRIIGIDKEGKAAASRLAALWPSMMAETTRQGQPSCIVSIPQSPSDSHDPSSAVSSASHPTVQTAGATNGGAAPSEAAPEPSAPAAPEPSAPDVPTISVIEMDAEGEELRPFLRGQTQKAWFQGPDGLTDCEVSLPQNARLYFMVCLGDDERSVDVALRCQRELVMRVLDGQLNAGTPPHLNPLVAVLVRNQEMLESVDCALRAHEHFSVVPFGSTAQAFSFASIIAAPWETAAIRLQGIYQTMNHLVKEDRTPVTHTEVMEAYNAFEVTKLSNRAATRFTPYRLWCVGLKSDTPYVSEALEQQYLLKLDVPHIHEQVRTPHSAARRLLCGIHYKETGTSPAACQTRRTQLASAEASLIAEKPVLSQMAALEHARWCAFMAANGWQPIQGDMEELVRLASFMGLEQTPEKPFPHRSIHLMRNYYLEHDLVTYRNHGADCRDDPFAADRLVTVASIHAMKDPRTE